jgi:hypothetical protein
LLTTLAYLNKTFFPKLRELGCNVLKFTGVNRTIGDNQPRFAAERILIYPPILFGSRPTRYREVVLTSLP